MVFSVIGGGFHVKFIKNKRDVILLSLAPQYKILFTLSFSYNMLYCKLIGHRYQEYESILYQSIFVVDSFY
jgi:hypothetical protein